MARNHAFIKGMIAGSALLLLLSLLVGIENDARTADEPSFLPQKPGRGPGSKPTRAAHAKTQRQPPSDSRFTATDRDLVTQLRLSQSVAEKTRLLKDIGYARLQRAVPELARIVSGAGGAVRTSAIESLGRIGSIEAVDILVGLTESGSSSVRHSSVLALGRSGDEEAIAWLKEIADANLLGMGPEALEAIGLSGDDRHIPYLVDMMEKLPHAIARGAANALASIGSPRARQVLLLSLIHI